MNDASLVSIIALLGWLVLALGAYRSHQISASKTIRTILIWGCIFLGVALVFTAIM
ncbi:hypothetical protein [Aurantiacibacter poecillastricola]|uniref:hypothetical protein n=1 Tax=Aurantiacibacter poecillastricola TaxID=3064385 RepID=UPI00273DAB15|nr:hypothetical protein [Aurantiacibacter sp. 219JJ12-13]MDP5261990.1 hypothetical protein [Aurantiacibacter sp. 219JJ12-13]